MNYLSIDFLIVYIFLVLTLVVGIRSSRGIRDIYDYAVMGGSWTTATLVLTVSATYIGGSALIGGVKNVFTDGIIVTAAALSSILGLLFVAFYIAPQLVQYKDCITVGDVAKKLFGPTAGIITGLIGLFNTTLLFSMQTLAVGSAVGSLLGLPNETSLLWTGGLIMIAYSTLGGIKAVTITDVLQLLVLITTITILAVDLTQQAGGLTHIFRTVPQEKFLIKGHAKFDYYLALAIIGYLLPTTFLTPPYIQRMLMARDAHQGKNVYLILSAFLPSVRVLVMLIGLATLVLYPHINPSDVFPTVVKTLPIGLKGFTIAGLLAILMSTADSALNSGSILLAHDIAKPIADKLGFKIDELKVARYATFILGLGSISISLTATDVVRLGFYAGSAVALFYATPLIAGIMGLKTSPKPFFAAMITTVIIFAIFNHYLPPNYSYLVVPIGVLANALSFFSFQLLENKR